MIPEQELVSRRALVGQKKRLKKGEVQSSSSNLGILLLGQITRVLRTIRGLKAPVFVVGGIVTEGLTLRDIDIVVLNPEDIPKIKKALGKFANRAHFIIQKQEPPAPLFVKITGKEPTSPDLTKKFPIPPYEYAGPA